jgi:hypothetical protein
MLPKMTIERLMEELDTFPWFKRVGETIVGADVKQVYSWEAAWGCLHDDSWINATFHQAIDGGSDVWGRFYDQTKALVRKASSFDPTSDINYPEAAAYDIACAASQLAAHSPNAFFVDLIDWYRAGHWPCGWDGTYPEGRLIVY